MPRPPFGLEKIKDICVVCGDTVWIPPGDYYRGEPMHKHCMAIREKQDHDDEIFEPMLDKLESELREVLDT